MTPLLQVMLWPPHCPQYPNREIMSLSGHPSGRQEFHQAKQLVGCLLERMGKIDSDYLLNIFLKSV